MQNGFPKWASNLGQREYIATPIDSEMFNFGPSCSRWTTYWSSNQTWNEEKWKEKKINSTIKTLVYHLALLWIVSFWFQKKNKRKILLCNITKEQHSSSQLCYPESCVLPKYELFVGLQPSENASFGSSTWTRASLGSTRWVYALPFEFTTNHCRSHRNPAYSNKKTQNHVGR